MQNSKYHISDLDLKTKCWYCSELVVGFDKTTGRERKPYNKHFCNSTCHEKFEETMERLENEAPATIA